MLSLGSSRKRPLRQRTRWSDRNSRCVPWPSNTAKTARHTGHESRTVPLFPELKPFLEAVFDQAEPGSEYVINRYRDATSNLRTQLTRIVKNAGLTPWPRIFHNMRASRQTELEEIFPTHVTCRWLGNSPQVARKHYLQLTDEHFERAIEGGTESGTLVAQNPAQQAHARVRNASQSRGGDQAQPYMPSEVTRSVAEHCEKTRKAKTEMHGNRTHRPHD